MYNEISIAAIHARHHIFVKSRTNWCCNRSANHFLSMRHINGWIVYDAIYAKYSAAAPQNIAVPADCERSPGVDTELSAASTIENIGYVLCICPYSWQFEYRLILIPQNCHILTNY